MRFPGNTKNGVGDTNSSTLCVIGVGSPEGARERGDRQGPPDAVPGCRGRIGAQNVRYGRVFHVAWQGEAFHAVSRRYAATSGFANPLTFLHRLLYSLYFFIIGDLKTFWTLPDTFPNISGSRILLPVQHPGPEMECLQACFTSASEYIPPVPPESIFTRFRTNRVQNGG